MHSQASLAFGASKNQKICSIASKLRRKRQKLPRTKIQKSGPRSFRYFHKLSKYPKIFQKLKN